MGKKSKSTPSSAVMANGNAGDVSQSKSAASPKVQVGPLNDAEAMEARDRTWRRFQRSLLGMMLLGGFAMTDTLALKECFTIVAPDKMPLAAAAILLVFLFRVARSRILGQDSSKRKSMHPVLQVLCFMVALTALTAVLPFNTTVTMYELPLFTTEECHAVANAAAAAVASPGFVPTRSRFDPTTEVPLEDLSTEVSTMVYEAFSTRLVPFIGLEYAAQGTVAVPEGAIYVEHYPEFHETHLRPRQLTVRVELTPPESAYVGGGGVALRSMGRKVTPGMGNALILPAKLRHGSSELGSGTRSVLVATMIVTGSNPWQRFMGIWRLWGLFAQRVRYIADRRMTSSGIDTIPQLDEAVDDVGAEGSLDQDAGAGGASSPPGERANSEF